MLTLAYRRKLPRTLLIDGLVIGIQAYFDPYVGYFDYVHHKLADCRDSVDRATPCTPQCRPKNIVPLYSVDGTKDWFYGQPPCFPGFEAVENWQNYSTQVLGCTGEHVVTQRGPHDFPQGSKTVCYTYPSCPAIGGSGSNVMCEVTDMTHDASSLNVLLPAAFSDFFGGGRRST